MYARTWLEPLLTLAHVAAVTDHCMIGTSVLIAPLRNPVLLAKEIATLQLLSRCRFILGAAAGWNPLDFAAAGVNRSERGSRLDEILQILSLANKGEPFSHSGKHYQVPELLIEPKLAVRPPVWIGGGRQPAVKGASEVNQETPQRVIDRIARADAWLAGAYQDENILRDEGERIRRRAAELGTRSANLEVAQLNYVHVVEATDRDTAYSEQCQQFARYVSSARPWSFVRDYYLVGRIPDIVGRLQRRIDAGVRHVIFNPVAQDPKDFSLQLELLANRIIPALVEPSLS